MQTSKVTFEQIARPLLAIVFILCYWSTHDANAVGTVANKTLSRHYEMPCYAALRADHPEVPHGDEDPIAYVAWWNSISPAEQSEWSSAVRACRSGHEAEYGKWNFDSMILVNTTEG